MQIISTMKEIGDSLLLLFTLWLLSVPSVLRWTSFSLGQRGRAAFPFC